MRWRYFSAIPQSGTTRLLALPTAKGWSLPCNDAGFHFWQEVHREHRLLQDELALDVYTLKLVWADYSAEKGRALYLYARTPAPQDWSLPPGAAWVEAAELAEALDEPDLAAGVTRWLRWSQETPASEPLPWSDPAWYGHSAAWTGARLDEAGLEPTGPAEQLTSRPRGTVFKTPVAGGAVYFKAVPRFFAHEPALTEWLGRRYPEAVAPVLASDPRRLCFLAKEIAGERLADTRDLACWEEALRRYARLQIDLAAHGARLRDLGCPRAELPAYAEAARRLVATESWGVSKADFAALPEKLPRLERLCRDLHESPLPLSLDHGDFSPWQILVGDAGPLLIDWSDSALAHPFFSLSTFYEALEYLRGDGPPPVKDMLADLDGVWQRLCGAYLEPWKDFAPMPELRRHLETASELAPLHAALKFARFLEYGVDTQWDMDGAVPMYLKKLL